MENFTIINKIGEGTYGAVYKSLNQTTGNTVAMKIIRLTCEDEGVPATAIREISFLKELKHSNIVELQEVVMMDKSIYLIFEYMNMDLRKFMDSLPSRTCMDEHLVRSYLYQVTSAILFCHQRRVLHRDLKPQNLLVDTHGRIKLTDFRLSRSFGMPVRNLTHEVVTLWYRAPEILLGAQRYACAVDIWAIGCIYFEMVTTSVLFRGDSEIDQLFRIFRGLGTPTEDTWPGVSELPDYNSEFPLWTGNQLNFLICTVYGRNLNDCSVELLKRMLTYSPHERITATEILKHVYFEGFQLEFY